MQQVGDGLPAWGCFPPAAGQGPCGFMFLQQPSSNAFVSVGSSSRPACRSPRQCPSPAGNTGAGPLTSDGSQEQAGVMTCCPVQNGAGCPCRESESSGSSLPGGGSRAWLPPAPAGTTLDPNPVLPASLGAGLPLQFCRSPPAAAALNAPRSSGHTGQAPHGKERRVRRGSVTPALAMGQVGGNSWLSSPAAHLPAHPGLSRL